MTEEELILTTVKNCKRLDLYLDPQPLTQEQQEELDYLKTQRKEGKPLQYLLKNCAFMDLTLLVNEHVLIPRPETELLVDFIIQKNKLFNLKKPRILDIGTGSGNIALSLAKHLPESTVTAVDISKETIDLAEQNAKANHLEGKVRFIESDFFTAFEHKRHKEKLFDIIVSNPPYIPADQLSGLSADVQQEPKIALDGGCGGLDFYRRIAKESSAYLEPQGFVFIEIGDGQKDQIEEIFHEIGVWSIKETLRDYCQTDRVLMIQLGT